MCLSTQVEATRQCCVPCDLQQCVQTKSRGPGNPGHDLGGMIIVIILQRVQRKKKYQHPGVWGIVETHSGAIFHASDYLLDKLDSAQRHFLNEVGVTETETFKEYNFAASVFRRDIGIFGFLHSS